jgi:glycosyltransferase involved in cell wall biosynthesis
MQAVKDQPTLVRAFLRLWSRSPDRHRLRLVLIGEGPLREECRSLLQAASAEHAAWLPGECAGIPELLRSLDLFVLPSIGEGISNTILEAMASALPLIVTRVGGNPELVDHAQTGMLVPPSDPVAMAEAIEHYYRNPQLRLQHGRAGRARVETRYSLDAMIEGYLRLYERILNRADKFETSTAATRER